ncbi:MAG: sulfite exporter TauE/SafE family protein [Candidatus Promineifilaceae bacterium]
MFTFPEHTLFFWAIVTLAVLIIGISKGGFGGGLGVIATPLLALIMPVADGAALLLPILIVADLFSTYRYREHVDWVNIRVHLPWALLGVVLGSLAFNYLADNERLFKLVLGMVALAFVVYQGGQGMIFGRLNKIVYPRYIRSILGAIAGFTSTIAHVGGPPLTISFLPQKLPRQTYVGTFLFFFLALNIVKLIPYSYLGLLRVGNLSLTLLMLPVVGIGAMIGQWLNGRFSDQAFQTIMYVFLTVTGLQLIFG